jgi:hypothetical protein
MLQHAPHNTTSAGSHDYSPPRREPLADVVWRSMSTPERQAFVARHLAEIWRAVDRITAA